MLCVLNRIISMHNIGFYEEMAKIMFPLSLNIIKYTLHLFFCQYRNKDHQGSFKANYSFFLKGYCPKFNVLSRWLSSYC